jgi:hypothetical protein
MSEKSLTENGWKVIVQKFKVKDNGLQKALAAYEKLDEAKFAERLKAIAAVAQLATNLQKAREIAALKDVDNYLDEMLEAAKGVPAGIKAAQAEAAKQAMAAKKQEQADQKSAAAGAEEDEEEETGDSYAKLKKALQTIKTAKQPYYFLVCDAKPYGLLISKKDIRKNSEARKELGKLAGGTTRPPKVGECRFENGKHVFEMEKPPSGLARILQKWVKEATGVGIKVMVGTESAEDEEGAAEPAKAAAAPSPEDEYDSPPPPPKLNLDPSSPEMRDLIQKTVQESMERERKEAMAKLEKANQALSEARKFLQDLPSERLSKLSYAQVMAEVRKRFPETADLAQWVKETALRVPDLKSKLPSKRALMDMVESVVKARGAEIGWSVGAGKDLKTLATDRLLAAYMSELPGGVTVKIDQGVVQLTRDGAALSVATPAGDVEAGVGKGGTKVELKAKDYGIEVANDGWRDFDPKLRAQWQRINDEASQVAKLNASLEKVKAEYERKKKDGTEIATDLEANLKKQEAEFNLRWKKLQEEVKANAKASTEKLAANVVYLKKDKNDKAALQAGAELEVDLKKMAASLKAFLKSPTLEAVLEVSASAEGISAKLELAAAKSGVVVTASFEQALDETKAAIEVMLRDGKTKIAAELKKKADDLTAKLKVVHQTKDLKLAAELEKTLKDVRGAIEVEYKQGGTTIKGGASASTSGEVSGKVQIDIELEKGLSFLGEGQKLSFTGNVSNKGYKFEVAFSVGEPAETGGLQDLFADADKQIKELYKLAGDKGVRSIADAKALSEKIQEVVKPIKASADKVKMLKDKSAIQASFGFSIEGDWPAGGKATPPAAMFNLKVQF